MIEGTKESAPLLLNAQQVGEMLGMARNTVLRLNREGLIPAGRSLGVLGYRWEKEELRAWVRAGCLPREEWEAAPKRRGA